MQAHLHLASGYVHISGAVLVQAGKDGVGGGRSGQLLDLRTKRFDLRLGFLQGRDEFIVLLGGLVELIAGLVQPTDFFLHRLDLHTEFFDLASLFVVPVNHVSLPLRQPLGDVFDGISEGPESARTSFCIGHGTSF